MRLAAFDENDFHEWTTAPTSWLGSVSTTAWTWLGMTHQEKWLPYRLEAAGIEWLAREAGETA